MFFFYFYLQHTASHCHSHLYLKHTFSSSLHNRQEMSNDQHTFWMTVLPTSSHCDRCCNQGGHGHKQHNSLPPYILHDARVTTWVTHPPKDNCFKCIHIPNHNKAGQLITNEEWINDIDN